MRIHHKPGDVMDVDWAGGNCRSKILLLGAIPL